MEATALAQDSKFRMYDSGGCSYRFVPENVNGAGGDLAKVLGGNFRQTFMQYQAGLEKELLARMREAMLKANESPDVAVSWARLARTIVTANLTQNPPPGDGQPNLAPLEGPVPAPVAPVQVGVSLNLEFLLNGRRAIPVALAHHAGSAVVHAAGTAILHTAAHAGAPVVEAILSGLVHGEHHHESAHEHKR